MARRLFHIAAVVVAVAWAVPVLNQTPTDWPQWRGVNRDGKSAETGLLTEWPAGGPPLVWKAGRAGTGYSSMSVAAGRLYTIDGKTNHTTMDMHIAIGNRAGTFDVIKSIPQRPPTDTQLVCDLEKNPNDTTQYEPQI